MVELKRKLKCRGKKYSFVSRFVPSFLAHDTLTFELISFVLAVTPPLVLSSCKNVRMDLYIYLGYDMMIA